METGGVFSVAYTGSLIAPNEPLPAELAQPPAQTATLLPDSPQLLDLPSELLAIIAADTGAPRVLGGTRRLLRAICLTADTRRMSKQAAQKTLVWKMAAARTVDEIGAVVIPDSINIMGTCSVGSLFLARTLPVLERAFAAAETAEERAHIDRVIARFVAGEATLVYDTAHILLPDTLARLALWFGRRVCKWITRRLLAAGKMRELAAGLALGLWYASEGPFVPPSLEREMLELAGRVDQEAAEQDRCYGPGEVSDELKWARVAMGISNTKRALESAVHKCMRDDWFHEIPNMRGCTMVAAREVFSAAFYIRRSSGLSVPVEELTAEEIAALDIETVRDDRIPFDEFDGNLRAPAWLLPHLDVYYMSDADD